LRRGLLGLRDIHDADATPVGTFCPASGQVDQDVPHQAGRHRQEVGTVLPIDVPPVQQANERFVNQGRGLKDMHGTLAPEMTTALPSASSN
jgi:hypothetical protein